MFQIWEAVGWEYKSKLIFVGCDGQKKGMTIDDYQEQILPQYAVTLS